MFYFLNIYYIHSYNPMLQSVCTHVCPCYLHSSHAGLVLLAEPQAKHEKCEHVEGVFLLQV